MQAARGEKTAERNPFFSPLPGKGEAGKHTWGHCQGSWEVVSNLAMQSMSFANKTFRLC